MFDRSPLQRAVDMVYDLAAIIGVRVDWGLVLKDNFRVAQLSRGLVHQIQGQPSTVRMTL